MGIARDLSAQLDIGPRTIGTAPHELQRIDGRSHSLVCGHFIHRRSILDKCWESSQEASFSPLFSKHLPSLLIRSVMCRCNMHRALRRYPCYCNVYRGSLSTLILKHGTGGIHCLHSKSWKYCDGESLINRKLRITSSAPVLLEPVKPCWPCRLQPSDLIPEIDRFGCIIYVNLFSTRHLKLKDIWSYIRCQASHTHTLINEFLKRGNFR